MLCVLYETSWNIISQRHKYKIKEIYCKYIFSKKLEYIQHKEMP